MHQGWFDAPSSVQQDGANESPEAVSGLAVVLFKDRSTAGKVLSAVRAQRALVSTDVCTAYIDALGRPHLEPAVGPAPSEAEDKATIGSLWATLVGKLLDDPLTEGAMAVRAGPRDRDRYDRLLECGIRDDFIRALREAMRPNCSALFLRIGGADDEGSLRVVQSYGVVLRTSLSETQAQRLRTVLSTVSNR